MGEGTSHKVLKKMMPQVFKLSLGLAQFSPHVGNHVGNDTGTKTQYSRMRNFLGRDKRRNLEVVGSNPII